jgi:hypothetical protein
MATFWNSVKSVWSSEPALVVETSIEINAPPNKVRDTFGDFNKYNEWSSFIKTIKGDKFVPGSKFSVALLPPGDTKETNFNPVLLKNDATEFRWKGVFGFNFVFAGEHYFKFEPVTGNSNKTRLVHGEKFGGLACALLGSVFTKTTQGFNNFNESLKKRVEG